MPVIVQSWKCNLSLQTTPNISQQIPVKTRDDILNLIYLLLSIGSPSNEPVENITRIPSPNITIINSSQLWVFVAAVKREREGINIFIYVESFRICLETTHTTSQAQILPIYFAINKLDLILPYNYLQTMIQKHL